MKVKMVCINNWIKINNEEAIFDTRLNVGSIYNTGYEDNTLLGIEPNYRLSGLDIKLLWVDELEHWYPIDFFITQEEWRERQLNKIL